MTEPVGIYLSIPFCKAKCSFCNFASGVFAADRMQGYVDRLCAEMRIARSFADKLGADLPTTADTVYFGGGTPSLLDPSLFRQIFSELRQHFQLAENPEITVECAPGQISDETLAELLRQGVNRLSFGVQSFVEQESTAVGRLHTPEQCLAEIERMHRAGMERLSLDLILGLPHQTEASWLHSVDQAIASGVEHISLYMLEVDEDSRLGREALSRGIRYGAPHLPHEDAAADWYLAACERLAQADIVQYEISNFARPGCSSRHNLKYWQRAPYLGFGLDAHSMLRKAGSKVEAVRWANPSEMDLYAPQPSAFPQLQSNAAPEIDRIGPAQAFEEAMFLGLRLNSGIDLDDLSANFGSEPVTEMEESMHEILEAGLIERQGSRVRLTAHGRMVSNEVFSRLLLAEVAA